MVLRKSYLDKIIPFIDQDLIKVLVGIRRCGKTVLLGQIKDVLLQRNIPAQNIIQANFESMRFRNTRTAETLYDYIAEKAEGCTGKIYILLDEIQEVERWQIAINSLRVDFDCDIWTIFTRLSLSVTSCCATIFANRPHYVMSLHSCWTISAIRFLPVISVDAWFRKESRQPLLPY